MKKIFSFAVMSSIVLATSMTSCKKDNNSNGSGNAGAGNLTPGKALVKATISGAHSANFESNTLVSTAVKSATILMTANKTPSGTTGTMETFMITLPANIKTGSYTNKDMSGQFGGTFTYSTSTLGGSQRGWQADADGKTAFTFTVTKISDTEVEGTFDGDMTNDTDKTVIKAKGSFAGKFQ